MRVLSCKIHCPSFICFCKPSAAAHLYNSRPLKLENSPHVPCEDTSHQLPPPLQQIQVEEDDGKKQQGGDTHTILRSCIKKKVPSPSSKKVQWVDSSGKQLADIKEFQSSETGDTDNEEENGGCLCNIL